MKKETYTNFKASEKSTRFIKEFKKVASFKGCSTKQETINCMIEVFSDLVEEGKVELKELI